MNTPQLTLTSTLNAMRFHTTGPLSQLQEPNSSPGSKVSAEYPCLHPSDPNFDLLMARLEELTRIPAPPPPVNDIFFCPPFTTERFKPRQFDTPEEEEAWWSDPRSFPGDHLIAPIDKTPLLSSSYEELAPRSYIVHFSESSDNEDVRTVDPHQIQQPPPPPPSASDAPSSDESDDSDYFSYDLSPISPGLAPKKTTAASHEDADVWSEIGTKDATDVSSAAKSSPGDGDSDEDHADDERDSDAGPESDSGDEYSPGATSPSHHTRAGPSRRSSRRTSSRSGPSRTTKGSRVHKPRVTVRKDTTRAPKRREFLAVSLEDLKLLRAEENRLRKSGDRPPPFEIAHPTSEKKGSKSLYSCAHTQDGLRCTKHSERAGEARRHMLTHSKKLRFLCMNSHCTSTFSRDDALKRHLRDNDCGKHHAPGISADTYQTTAIKEDDGSYRLVRIVWTGPDAPVGQTSD